MYMSLVDHGGERNAYAHPLLEVGHCIYPLSSGDQISLLDILPSLRRAQARLSFRYPSRDSSRTRAFVSLDELIAVRVHPKGR